MRSQARRPESLDASKVVFYIADVVAAGQPIFKISDFKLKVIFRLFFFSGSAIKV